MARMPRGSFPNQRMARAVVLMESVNPRWGGQICSSATLKKKKKKGKSLTCFEKKYLEGKAGEGIVPKGGGKKRGGERLPG